MVERQRYMQLLLYRRLRVRRLRHASSGTEATQGPPQGCPVSPSVFAAVAEDSFRPAVAGWIDAGLGFPTSDGYLPITSFADYILLLAKKGEVYLMMKEESASLLEAGLRIQTAKDEYMVICLPSDEVPLCP